jgi:hypothetical protein
VYVNVPGKTAVEVGSGVIVGVGAIEEGVAVTVSVVVSVATPVPVTVGVAVVATVPLGVRLLVAEAVAVSVACCKRPIGGLSQGMENTANVNTSRRSRGKGLIIIALPTELNYTNWWGML